MIVRIYMIVTDVCHVHGSDAATKVFSILWSDYLKEFSLLQSPLKHNL